jgi:hypothetical protein
MLRRLPAIAAGCRVDWLCLLIATPCLVLDVVPTLAGQMRAGGTSSNHA